MSRAIILIGGNILAGDVSVLGRRGGRLLAESIFLHGGAAILTSDSTNNAKYTLK